MWLLEWLWHSAWGWWGLTGTIVIGCIVVGYFFPSFRGKLLVVAGAALSASTIYTMGRRDKQKEWDDAEGRMVDKSNKARDDAERAVAADPDGMRDDKFNRDRG